MAIAGLHNVPVLESSMFRESQSSSSGQRVNHGNISTRASSILQMWRELEDECAVNRARERGRPRFSPRAVTDSSFSPRGGIIRGGLEESSESENGSLMNSESQMGRLNDQEDVRSITSEQSLDLGEVERERVRKIFREWMSSGGNGETPRAAHINRSSRSQCVGVNEIDRVRVVRNWIQTTSQPRGGCLRSREDQLSDTGSPIDQVRSGQAFNNLNEGQPQTTRRQIRKLCGRQALLDLLAKKEQERRQELQCLEGSQPVTRFAHRNRIQSFLRLRCFQIRGSTEVRRPNSPAESELGLLRQRQTVSGLREGFLSRLDNNGHVQTNGVSVGSSENDSVACREDRTQANCSNEVLDSVNELNDSSTEVLDVVHEENSPRDNVDVAASTDPSNMDSDVGSSAELDHLTDCNESTSSQRLEAEVEGRLEQDLDNSVICNVSSYDEIRYMNPEVSPRMESGLSTIPEERHESTREHYSDMEEPNILNDPVNITVDVNDRESDVPEAEEQSYGREWESDFSSQRREDSVETDGLHLPGDGADHSREALESEGGEQIDMEEDYWHENGSQETPRDWLEMASDSNRVDTNYFSDDDNVYHVELRELVNRRTVSSLLHSDFRESLDQIIQSYVERQANPPDDWELHEMLPPPFMSRNPLDLYNDQDEYGPNDINASGSEPMFSPPPPPPLPQANWGRRVHQNNWARQDVRHRHGPEWEIVNDLRIDMSRLQQRLNNMQRMLETCMDMQVELQRAVRQEVSDALSRSANASESLEISLPDSLKWDCVRKGVCCICSNTTIDSLLYRCGHMCTCAKCADNLVQGNWKCPMCQAPVVEVIRAYFIQ